MEENKKSKSNIVIIVIVLIALIVLIVLKNNIFKNNQPKELTEEQKTSIEVEQAVKSDSTEDIKNNINNITIEDTTDKDMESIDNELETL